MKVDDFTSDIKQERQQKGKKKDIKRVVIQEDFGETTAPPP